MAELNPLLDGQINGGGGDGAGTGEMIVGSTGKRQRRPSVRLGDIGGEPPPAAYETLHHHSRKGSSKLQAQYAWKQLQKGSSRLKSNETLVDKDGIKSSEDGIEGEEDNEGDLDLDLDRVAIGSWKTFGDGSKSKRGRGGSIRKRVRSNWVSSKIDESEKLLTSGGEGEGDGDEGFHLDNDEGMDRDFGLENLEEEMEEVERNESPIRSFDNNNDNEDVDVDRKRGFLKFGEKNRRRVTTMVSDEMEGPSDSIERNGVKIWLNQLGLGRYGPVFEIHEVDDEVLPMLTLEDLKDMGINAVGTRRKMYCSIQKLNKGFF